MCVCVCVCVCALCVRVMCACVSACVCVVTLSELRCLGLRLGLAGNGEIVVVELRSLGITSVLYRVVVRIQKR